MSVKMADWYTVHMWHIKRIPEGAKLFEYHPTLPTALAATYPDYPWELSKFSAKREPRGFWHRDNNLMKGLESAEKKLGVKDVCISLFNFNRLINGHNQQPADWYGINLADLYELGLPRLLTRPKLIELLEQKYPGYDWKKITLLKGKYAPQRRLQHALSSLFPVRIYYLNKLKESLANIQLKDVEMKVNVRKEAELARSPQDSYLELDIFFPALNLAFEHQV